MRIENSGYDYDFKDAVIYNTIKNYTKKTKMMFSVINTQRIKYQDSINYYMQIYSFCTKEKLEICISRNEIKTRQAHEMRNITEELITQRVSQESRYFIQ